MLFSRTVLRARAAVLATAFLLIAVSLLADSPNASADTSPVNPAEPVSVSSDALPTPQIDGVVWAQVVVGSTVYVGGDFQTVRPYGSAAGVNTVSQPYLFAYDITTGNMITGFAPALNGQVKALAVSPDGTRLYVAGGFTTINGLSRYRIASFDLPSATLDTRFIPQPNATVSALAVSSSAVYLGGTLTAMGTTARSNVAAVDPLTGALLPWAPLAAGGNVAALALSPDGSKVSIGGAFTTLNGGNGKTNPGLGGYGMGIVSATGTGTSNSPMIANNLVRDATSTSGITSMSSDADSLYVTGYDFGSGGNFEGTLRLNWADGSIIWMEDCHGDTYSAFAMGGLIYKASHAHTCVTVPDGFPETTPRTHHYALAFTKAVYGTLGTNPASGYSNYAGQPAPDQVNWYPDFTPGTFTGQDQATWSVSGNSQYILYGGEFPTVDGKPQQGLARFAAPTIAPNVDGPRLSGANWSPTAQSLSPGTITVTWPANYDRDNELLVYNIRRNDNGGYPSTTVGTTSAISRFYDTTQTVSYVDTGLTPGAQYGYTVQAVDPFGNKVVSATVMATASTGTPLAGYAQGVLASNPDHYWRLDEASGVTAADIASGLNLTTQAGVTRNVAGAIAGDSDTASQFSGTSTGSASTTTTEPAPRVFTEEAWFKTNSTTGGEIIGFGNASTGNSTTYDRQVYLTPTGKVSFNAYFGSMATITSQNSYNDGNWHYAVATLSSAGMALYVDGTQVGQNSSVLAARSGSGFWRLGGDTLTGGAKYLAGTIDEAAVYDTVLTPTQIQNHYALGTGGTAVNSPPTASFTSSANYLSVVFNASASTDADGQVVAYQWNFGDGTSGTGATPTHVYSNAGQFTVTLTVTDNQGAIGTTQSAITATVPPNVPPTATFTSTSSGLVASFDASGSTDSDGSIASYSWNFGDNSAAVAGANPTHAYTSANTYLVTLTVTDNRGGIGVYSANVTVSANVPPTASFTSSVTGLSASFNAAASSDTDGTIASYQWNFGDGSGTATTVSPSYTYAAAGTYSVTLTVTDNLGASSTTSASVVIPVATPVVITPVSAPPVAVSQPIYRFWSQTLKAHFYTISADEKAHIIATYPPSVWTYEGVAYSAFTTQVTGTIPLYRFWSALYGDHFYTTSAAERDYIIATYPTATWSYEGIAYYVYPSNTTLPNTTTVARFWSPSYHTHFYTASAAERDQIIATYPKSVWTFEGEEFSVPTN